MPFRIVGQVVDVESTPRGSLSFGSFGIDASINIRKLEELACLCSDTSENNKQTYVLILGMCL